ncbi:hypothetical protein ASE01_21915 [Nocardioides sp. Root190]|uniref:S1C family serine protease n=1 Tax=Nocardioides sp. Root190 TaxID=1736488 RepID=UPI0006FC8053|nr:trypsin-like peptidase domain-containing protein [Nocardioides sp. Root190]KRB72712.1 hypothetical protein ASE01_21915 [Nocardioides sp. Root190]
MSSRTPTRTRHLVLAGTAASVLLVGSGAASAAVALQLLDAKEAGSFGAAASTPSTAAQDTDDPTDPTDSTDQTPYQQRGPGLSPGAGTAPAETSTETAADATDEESEGIVQIASTLTNGSGAGTGLVLDSDGTIVTNHHVVAGATSLEVTVVSTGETYTARYVGGDAVADVAVLQLEGASGLTPVDLSEDAAAVGDEIVAVGDAGGDGGTLTASPGTVTALGQDITVQSTDGSAARLTDLIKLDAYIVPGDSGGAVLDDDGDVVGMNVAASTGNRDVIGYAIAITTVEAIVEQIESGTASGDVTLGYDGYLGVGLSPDATTPLVAQVIDGTAAEGTGLVAGDTVTAVDDTAVGTADELRAAIAAHAAGDRVRISWTTSSGERRSALVTLGEGPVS